MRNVLAASVLLVAVIAFATPLHAQNPSWCAIMDNDGNLQCNYFTEQQCLQTLSGIGGRCVTNPAGSAPQPMPAAPSSENAQGLLPLQLQNPGPPPGLDGSAVPPPPNN
ncbi:MAG: DUF3551 domain-containing protein [Pseudolabrys sp.]